MVPNDTGFTDDRARAMIDEEMGPDARAGMHVHATTPVSPFCHDAWNQWNVLKIQFVRYSLHGNRLDKRVGDARPPRPPG